MDTEQTDSEAPLTAKDEEIIHNASFREGLESVERVFDLSMYAPGNAIRRGLPAAILAVKNHTGAAWADIATDASQYTAQAYITVDNELDEEAHQWAVRLPRPLTDAEIAAINNWCDDKAKVELYEKDMEHFGPDTLPYNANQAQSNAVVVYQRYTDTYPQLSEAIEAIEGIAEDIRSQACTYGAGAPASQWSYNNPFGLQEHDGVEPFVARENRTATEAMVKARADATRYGGSLKENLAQARHAELKRIKQKMWRHVAGATQAMTGARQAEPTKLERPLVNPMLYTAGATHTISGGPAALHNLPQNPNQAMIDRDGPPKAKTPAAFLPQPGPAPAKPTPPLPVADITRTGTHFGRWGAGL